jgi:Bacterial pre-peptidase C-terminal domain
MDLYSIPVLPTKITPMLKFFRRLLPLQMLAILLVGNVGWVAAQENKVYTPLSLSPGSEVKDSLTDKDIPLGDGGFARDYSVQLNAGDQVAIEVTSDNFDTVVLLLTKDGKTLGKNDDGPDGTSNSLLFSRIKKAGNYTIRVQGFGDTSGGKFTLKVSRLTSQP